MTVTKHWWDSLYFSLEIVETSLGIGNREATVGFDERGLAGGLALICLPLPLGLSDGIDVVGFDVIGLAYGLAVIGLPLGLPDELDIIGFVAVKMV